MELQLGSSPLPAVWLPTELLRRNSVLDVAGVTVILADSSGRSTSGVSGGISDVSVMAGLDSAPEHSEYASSSTRFCGVVNAGLRNGGAENLFGIWGWKNEECGGCDFCLEGEPAAAKGLGFCWPYLDGELREANTREREGEQIVSECYFATTREFPACWHGAGCWERTGSPLRYLCKRTRQIHGSLVQVLPVHGPFKGSSIHL